MKEILLLTEASLPRLLWRSILGRPTGIVACRSIIGGATRHLEWLADRLVATGRVTRILDARPDLAPFTDYGDLMRLADPFVEAEPWIGRYFKFDQSDDDYGEYAIAYRHVCCNAVFQRFGAAFVIDGAISETAPGETRVSGLDAVDRGYYRNRFSDRLAAGPGRPRLVLLVNFMLLLSTILRSAFWIIRRIRAAPPPPETVFMGSDYVGGNHDRLLWDEVVDGGGDVMVVMRNAATAGAFAETMGRHRHCLASDGWFRPGDGLKALRQMARHSLGIFRRGRRLPSDFFRKLVVLPHKRMVYRALFNRFRFRFFWSRDEYNADHIMRSQELRKTGAVSMGLMHGIPGICVLSHQMRHLDYDRFYMLGRDQYERFYRHTWPSHMKVSAIGSFGVTRDEIKKMMAPRPNNIACFLSPSYHQEQIMAGIEDLARRFPDRTVFLNIKTRKYTRGSMGQALNRLLARAPENLILDWRRSYELLLECQYVVNESSTLTAEAAQFGLCAFVFDPDPRTRNLYYRQIPEICLDSMADIARRIGQIEAESWRYPRDRFGPIINLTGDVSWDLIRADMGLPPNGPAGAANTGHMAEPIQKQA